MPEKNKSVRNIWFSVYLFKAFLEISANFYND